MNDQSGAGSGGEVLLLHGWACPVGYWKPLQGQLEEQGHAVRAATLPGYGPQAPLPSGLEFNVEEVAQFLAGKLAAGSRSPTHLVGHSLGGSIAATIAARHPDLAASATLLGMVPTPPSIASRDRLTAQFLNGPIDDDAIQLCLDAWYGAALPADRRMVREPFGISRNVLDASLVAALEGVADDVPGHITTPVQVLVGAEDKTRSLPEVHGYIESHPGTSLTVVAGAGHMVHWEAPELCAAAIHRFVAG